MNAPDILSRVKRLIEAYPGDRYLYIHRCPLIVQCSNWDFSNGFVRGTIWFERLVTGMEWQIGNWEFSVRWDFIYPYNLDRRMLSGCQLRDTIILDSDLFDAALSVYPDSDEGIRSAFHNRINAQDA